MIEEGRNPLKKIRHIFKEGKIKKDNFLIMILAGILLLVIAWPGSDSGDSSGEENHVNESGVTDTKDAMMNVTDAPMTPEYMGSEAYTADLERRLEEVLSVMEGAGKVKVMVTLSSSEEQIVEKDAPSSRAGTTEVDGAGGSRNTTDMDMQQETVLVSDQDGSTVPFVKKTIYPEIEGVVVAAQGGDNIKIIHNITEAIKVLFGIEEHKIKIVKMIS